MVSQWRVAIGKTPNQPVAPRGATMACCNSVDEPLSTHILHTAQGLQQVHLERPVFPFHPLPKWPLRRANSLATKKV